MSHQQSQLKNSLINNQLKIGTASSLFFKDIGHLDKTLIPTVDGQYLRLGA